jgi:hypothetical protein
MPDFGLQQFSPLPVADGGAYNTVLFVPGNQE